MIRYFGIISRKAIVETKQNRIETKQPHQTTDSEPTSRTHSNRSQTFSDFYFPLSIQIEIEIENQEKPRGKKCLRLFLSFISLSLILLEDKACALNDRICDFFLFVSFL